MTSLSPPYITIASFLGFWAPCLFPQQPGKLTNLIGQHLDLCVLILGLCRFEILFSRRNMKSLETLGNVFIVDFVFMILTFVF